MLHIFCDYCGAEGPTLIGERRPELLKEVISLGWVIKDNNHMCMECTKPRTVAPTVVTKVEVPHNTPCPVPGCPAPKTDVSGRSHWASRKEIQS